MLQLEASADHFLRLLFLLILRHLRSLLWMKCPCYQNGLAYPYIVQVPQGKQIAGCWEARPLATLHWRPWSAEEESYTAPYPTKLKITSKGPQENSEVGFAATHQLWIQMRGRVLSTWKVSTP